MKLFRLTKPLLRSELAVNAFRLTIFSFAAMWLGISPSVAFQTVARRVAQQEEPFIDTSEWVQSTSPFGDTYDRNYITETIVRGYRGPGSDQSIQPTYRDEALEFSKESKIEPIRYADVPTQSGGSRNSLSTSVNNSVNQEPPMLRPIPDASINGPSGIYPTQSQSGNSQMYAANGYGQGLAPQGYASQAAYGQLGYAQPAYQPNNFSSQTAQRNAFVQNAYTQHAYQPQSYFASDLTWASPSPYQNSSAVGGYPVNYVQAQYAPQPNAPQQFTPPQYNASPYNPASPYAYTSMLTNCCDPVYQPTQFTTPNVNPNPNALQTYPQYRAPSYGFGGTQPYQRTTWVPVIPLRSMPYGTYLGQGIVGQPVAYVDGEPVRNFLRYVFP